MILLGCIREASETWRDAVSRIGYSRGHERECVELFDKLSTSGEDKAHAAWQALNEYNCLDSIDLFELLHS